ncbi:MAG: hypothetical protein IID35_11250 [Planctomycetes bacterium]|nr:hypothetical protein [Planctomycetota bacterium]
MKLAKSSPELMTLTVGLNFWSWGERVTVALGVVDGCNLIDITSSCVLKMQIADWGKNERNVRKLFDEIDKILGDASEHLRCQICRKCDYLLVGIPDRRCPECGHEYSLSDMPNKQEVATFKNAISIVVVVTALEFMAVSLLDVFGAGGFLPSMLHGVRGAVNLLFFNLVTLLGIVGLHRLTKRYTSRR